MQYLAGKTVYALSVQYRVDDKTIVKRLLDDGVELRAAKRGLPDREPATILALRAAGRSYNRIGEHYQRCGTAIRNFVLKPRKDSDSSLA